MIDLQRDGDVFVLRMDFGENRFSTKMMDATNAALDEVEGAGSPCALVTTGTGKFYSNGLDLEEMMSGSIEPGEYISRVLAIFERVLLFPAVTVAAVNGHAFGAGGQLIQGHDFRLMRNDRGFFCMPEIDMKAPLHPGMTAILQARLPQQTLQEVIVTGKRWGGEEAASRGIVDEALAEDALIDRAKEIAAPLAGKADKVMSVLKRGMHKDVVAALHEPMPAAG